MSNVKKLHAKKTLSVPNCFQASSIACQIPYLYVKILNSSVACQKSIRIWFQIAFHYVKVATFYYSTYKDLNVVLKAKKYVDYTCTFFLVDS